MRSFLFFIFCIFTALNGFSQDLPEQAIPLIPKEILFGNPEKVRPKLSPDGNKLAYLAPDENNVMNVWVQDLQGETKAEKVSDEPKRSLHDFFWEFSSNAVYYLQDFDGDENFHIFRAKLTDKTSIDLTPYEGIRVHLLTYEPQHPNEMLIGMNLRNPSHFDVYKLNIETEHLSLVFENNVNALYLNADHNLEVRAITQFDREGSTLISVRENEDSPWKVVMQFSPLEIGHFIGFSHNNDSIYLLTNKFTNTLGVIELSLSDNSIKVIAFDESYDISHALVNPNTHKIVAAGVGREKFEWIVLDEKIRSDFDSLYRSNEVMRISSEDLDKETWIVVYSSDKNPASYYLYDRNTQELTFLFHAIPELIPFSKASMKPIEFIARDGMLIHGYLTLPVEESENLATVLFVHGGPWSRDIWGYNSYVQWLANCGYAVLQVNFRGSTGYGKEYLNAGNKEWAGKMHTDLLDGKKWLIDRGVADPERVAIFGGSYGGYATLVGLTFTPEEFCCGIDIVGPSNIVTLLETIPPYWSPMKTIFDVRVGCLETEREFLESRSPLFKADQIIRPLLIAQGANDPRVKRSESDQIVQKMRENGQEVEYLLFDDEGHGFGCSENRGHFVEKMEEFLMTHMPSGR